MGVEVVWLWFDAVDSGAQFDGGAVQFSNWILRYRNWNVLRTDWTGFDLDRAVDAEPEARVVWWPGKRGPWRHLG